MSIVALSKRYSCRYGAPLIDRVDTEILTLRYFARCMDCTFCNDQCCSYGVDVDTLNVDRLLARADELEPVIGAPRSAWFIDEWADDKEYPGGRVTRVSVRDGRCMFRKRDGRGCAVHAFALERGIDYHDLKPLVSAIFPLTFDDRLLHAAEEVLDGDLVCRGGDGETLYDGVRDEVTYYFGAEMTAELDALAAQARSR